jgi:predicted dehydrogenase/nucleoside-diphosphate-sugar epimerase
MTLPIASQISKGPDKPLRVGIVGCGRVAAHHLRFISQVPGAVIAGVADQDEALARQLGERYNATHITGSLDALLEKASLDVLHVLTPPFNHYDQTLLAIEHGVHVLIEKPVTFRASETEELYQRAAARRVVLCPDFIQLFHPAFLQARAAVDSGELGRVIHVESCLSEPLSSPDIREARGLNWAFQLPGGIIHNFISHPLYLALYFLGYPERISATPRSMGALPQSLTDHLEVSIETPRGSGYVVVSHATQSRPSYFANIFCEKGVVSVNFDTSTVLINKPSGLPRSVERASSNFVQAGQLCKTGVRNILDYVQGRLVPYQGLQELIPQFYDAIRNNTLPPISSDLAKAVVRAEESIFAQAGKVHLDLRQRPARTIAHLHAERVLVTGAAGHLGSEIVRSLVREGYHVRAMVRPLSDIRQLEELGVEIVFGDVRDLDSLIQAAQGVDFIIHAAAGLRGTTNHIVDSCVIGTHNVSEAAQKANVRRVIYISSMSVYDFPSLKNGAVITEQTPLDEHAELRGAYSLGKRKAEAVALAHLQDEGPHWTILRPSVIVGHGRNPLGPTDGIQVGSLIICMSPPRKNLRLIHVEDVATAVLRILGTDSTRGKIFVLSSPERLPLAEYIRVCVKSMSQHRNSRVLHVPSWFATLGVSSLMVLKKVTGKGPSMNLRRLSSAYRDVGVNSETLKAAIDWEPPRGLLDRLRRERTSPAETIPDLSGAGAVLSPSLPSGSN